MRLNRDTTRVVLYFADRVECKNFIRTITGLAVDQFRNALILKQIGDQGVALGTAKKSEVSPNRNRAGPPKFRAAANQTYLQASLVGPSVLN
jgi:hypothetical protein